VVMISLCLGCHAKVHRTQASLSEMPRLLLEFGANSTRTVMSRRRSTLPPAKKPRRRSHFSNTGALVAMSVAGLLSLKFLEQSDHLVRYGNNGFRALNLESAGKFPCLDDFSQSKHGLSEFENDPAVDLHEAAMERNRVRQRTNGDRSKSRRTSARILRRGD
jgi:hypothetical protein